MVIEKYMDSQVSIHQTSSESRESVSRGSKSIKKTEDSQLSKTDSKKGRKKP